MIIASPLGEQHREMVIDAGADSFSATVSGADGTHTVSGTVAGNKLSWTDRVTHPMKLTLHFDVTVSADEMTGAVKLGIFGKAKFSATRGASRASA